MDNDFLQDLDDLGGDEGSGGEEEGQLVTSSYLSSSKSQNTNDHSYLEGEEAEEEADDDKSGNGEEQEENELDWFPGEEEEISASSRLLNAQLESKIKAAKDIKSIAKLAQSKIYRDTMDAIAHHSSTPRNPMQDTGPIEEDPEYQVMVNANNLVLDIDTEISTIHKFICDKYAPRFKELESLVINPVDYARAVKMIGNEMDLSLVDLKSFLPTATVMVITVTASTSAGTPIPSKEELNRIIEACDIIIDLSAARLKILQYVESRMSFIAPNLSAIIGPNVSAKLMAIAGGLTALSNIPSCNLIVLGAQKKANTGLSNVGSDRHHGVIYTCDLISRIPTDYRRQAARMVSGKCVLAARIDRSRSACDGSHGINFRSDLEKKIEVLQAPSLGSKTKALPIPGEGPKKRRAGKRFRRGKEMMAVTELRKAQNRMSFGVAEEEISLGTTGETIGLGMVTGNLSGKLRAAQADTRVKVPMSKKHKAFANHSSGMSTSGLSSVAFTPVQGIELHNPEAASLKQRGIDTSSKYFGNSTFFKHPPVPSFGGKHRSPGLSNPPPSAP